MRRVDIANNRIFTCHIVKGYILNRCSTTIRSNNLNRIYTFNQGNISFKFFRVFIEEKVRRFVTIYTQNNAFSISNQSYFRAKCIHLLINLNTVRCWPDILHDRIITVCANYSILVVIYGIRFNLSTASKMESYVSTCIMINVIFKEFPAWCRINISIPIIFQCESCFMFQTNRKSWTYIVSNANPQTRHKVGIPTKSFASFVHWCIICPIELTIDCRCVQKGRVVVILTETNN